MMLKQLLMVDFDTRKVSFLCVGHHTKQYVLQISKLKNKQVVVVFIAQFFIVSIVNKSSLKSFKKKPVILEHGFMDSIVFISRRLPT